MRPDRALSARGMRFAIATPHHLATRAGAEAFEAGGNAVDAALAAAVALAVAYPHQCGVGGDLFALVQEPDGRTISLNASGAAPMGIDPDALRAAARPARGPLTITVPGAVSGWAELAKLWSRRGFAAAFDTGIRLAGEGVPVARSLARGLREDADALAKDPGTADVFFRDGRPLAEGETVVQPALARTLETLAAQGPGAFYGGDVGRRLVAGLGAAGSPIAIQDLERHRPELDSPLRGRYRDLDVSVVPPNSQGFVLLAILGAVERLGIDPDPLGSDAALLAEVFLATAADRDRHNADPRLARVPVGTLLDEGHLAALCDQVRERTPRAPTRHGADTIALVAADAEGFAVSLIQSLSDQFGSRILEPSTGVVCHNRGADFSLDPSSPNAIAGGKRPAHTLMPVLVHRGGRLAAVSGSRGGGAQPQINAMSIFRLFDLGMGPGDVLAAPRWLVGGMGLNVAGRPVDVEEDVPVGVRRALGDAGYRLTLLEELDQGVGHAHLIRVGPDGLLEAASDPRADGEAAAH